MMKRFVQFLQSLGCWVVADATDNSVTFSRALFKKLRIMDMDEAKVFVFKVAGTGSYGFMLNPPIREDTQLAEVMYNGRYRCIGFECLVPTVNRIFYDYGLAADTKCKLSVRRVETVNGMVYYEICKPYAKSFGK